jgi:hypothetical protein
MKNMLFQTFAWKEKPTVSLDLQFIFEAGKKEEENVKDVLNKAGITISQCQNAISFNDNLVTGHIDGILTYPEDTKPQLAEIKSTNEHTFNKLNNIDDFINGSVLHQRYWYQVTMYMDSLKLDRGVFILSCFRKLPKFVEFSYDKDMADKIKEMLNDACYHYKDLNKQINDGVSYDVILEKINALFDYNHITGEKTLGTEHCKWCNFQNICKHYLQNMGDILLKSDSDTVVVKDATLAELIQKYQTAKETADGNVEYADRLKEQIMNSLPKYETKTMNYLIQGKECTKKIKYTRVSTTRFDSAGFKKANPAMYNLYVKESSYGKMVIEEDNAI